MRARGLALIALATACTSSPPPTHRVEYVPVTASVPRSCDPNDVPLRVDRHEGRAVRAFVDVTKDDTDARFLFDTGAAYTHVMHSLEDPRYLRRTGNVRVACKVRVLDSWPQNAYPKSAGLDVVGVLGADTVMKRPTELDLRSDRLRFYDRLPDEVSAWPALPLEISEGVLLTRAKVDGHPARLLVDTGTDALLIVTEQPGAGEIVTTTDVFANRLDLVWGSAQLAWDCAAGTKVSAWRTRAHPAFERHAKALGGAGGILGLSALGNRRLVFDVAHAFVYVEPQACGGE